ncbi:MAG: glycosyltransferase, partial [Bryobacteraceae bacterium]|nr:glycosyltransferase [Bryobacteraceae bacterium]
MRVALFTDSYHEMNGVGTLSREFAHFAERSELPFCSVHAGDATGESRHGSVHTIELKRSPAAFALDKDLYCDPLLSRYKNLVIDRLRKFRPDLIHITGPGDMGILGFWASNILKIPMAASWHTNLHEYASKRLQKAFRFAPCQVRNYIGETAESQSLRALMGFYRLAHFTLAPNQGMVNLLDERTGRPAYLMQHGVDADRFCPQRR